MKPGKGRLSAESLRKRRWRERIKAAQALGLEARSDPPPVPGPVPGHNIPGQELLKGLQRLAGDESAGGQARVSAARTVLEAQGVLGRHATGQRDKASDVPPALLTREALVRELGRLRRSILPGTRAQVLEDTGDATP